MKVKPLRRLPLTWGWMSKRVPDDVMTAWFEPATKDAAIRRDLRAYCTQLVPKAELVAATERLREFDKPALVAWASEDKIMPPEHGRRLAELLPQGRLVEIPDSYTLIPEDQPRVAGRGDASLPRARDGEAHSPGTPAAVSAPRACSLLAALAPPLYRAAIRAALRFNLARVRKGDTRLLFATYADDVHFRFPGDSSWAADIHSKEELQRWVRRFVDVGLQLHPRARSSSTARPGARASASSTPTSSTRPDGDARLREPRHHLRHDRLGQARRVRGQRGHPQGGGPRRVPEAARGL